MIKRTMLIGLIGIFLVSCTSIEADQPTHIEEIDGFTNHTFSSRAEIVYSDTDRNNNTDTTNYTFARKHEGSVLTLASVPETESFFSGGADGFLSLHLPSGNTESWQISNLPICTISVNPDGNRIAVYESDGFSIHRVSVWDWKNKKRIYAKRLHDSVMSLAWSAKGSFLMIGNSSLEGIIVLNGSDGTVKPVFKDTPGVVTLSVTGSTETSMITFGPSGRIVYTDIKTGDTRAQYTGPHDIQSPVLFANNLKIAGYTNDSVLEFDATSGNELASYTTANCIMATSLQDTVPIWIEKTETDGWDIREGESFSPEFVIPDKSTITAALNNGQTIVIGTSSGMLYSIPRLMEYTDVPVVTPLVQDSLHKIDDVCTDNSRLFILSEGILLVSAGPGKAPIFAFDNITANRVAFSGDYLLTWSTDKNDPIIRQAIDGEYRTVVYQPTEGIHSLVVSGETIAFIEGSKQAVVLNLNTPEKIFTYPGAGLQDIVILSTDKILISKSTTTRSPSPLLLINTITGETVPLGVTGNLCFGITLSDSETNHVKGFIVNNVPTTATELVDISLGTISGATPGSVHTIASFSDEDLTATLALIDDTIITNLGKNALIELYPGQNKQIQLARGYSLPAKVVFTDQFIISLNLDGSLTWFDRKSGKFITDSAITNMGFWVE